MLDVDVLVSDFPLAARSDNTMHRFLEKRQLL